MGHEVTWPCRWFFSNKWGWQHYNAISRSWRVEGPPLQPNSFSDVEDRIWPLCLDAVPILTHTQMHNSIKITKWLAWCSRLLKQPPQQQQLSPKWEILSSVQKTNFNRRHFVVISYAFIGDEWHAIPRLMTMAGVTWAVSLHQLPSQSSEHHLSSRGLQELWLRIWASGPCPVCPRPCSQWALGCLQKE